MTNRYPLHHTDAQPLYVNIPQEEYDRINRENLLLKSEVDNLRKKFNESVHDNSVIVAETYVMLKKKDAEIERLNETVTSLNTKLASSTKRNCTPDSNGGELNCRRE